MDTIILDTNIIITSLEIPHQLEFPIKIRCNHYYIPYCKVGLHEDIKVSFRNVQM